MRPNLQGFFFQLQPINPNQLAGFRGALPPGAQANPSASDPVGGTSPFDALEKVGLKLEPQKRSYPVFVIDHIDEKPTGN